MGETGVPVCGTGVLVEGAGVVVAVGGTVAGVSVGYGVSATVAVAAGESVGTGAGSVSGVEAGVGVVVVGAVVGSSVGVDAGGSVASGSGSDVGATTWVGEPSTTSSCASTLPGFDRGGKGTPTAIVNTAASAITNTALWISLPRGPSTILSFQGARAGAAGPAACPTGRLPAARR